MRLWGELPKVVLLLLDTSLLYQDYTSLRYLFLDVDPNPDVSPWISLGLSASLLCW